MPSTTKYPFEASRAEVEGHTNSFIDVVFASLQSSFLLLPRGSGFITYPDFQQAYEVLKRQTGGFVTINSEQVVAALRENALVFIVLRAMLGFSPPEWAYLAAKYSGIEVSQGFARSLDRRVRTARGSVFQTLPAQSQTRVEALVVTVCKLFQEERTDIPADIIHRLDKVDTRRGAVSFRHVATEGVPYAKLLYERFLGRPFAAHRDSVSELVGAVMENAVEDKLREAGISFRKTKRAERIEGFDQAPDFIVPDEWNPAVVIEAKITEDDGTARDKVTRIQHLAEISRQQLRKGLPGFQVIACIDGRGFGVRREDMRKLLMATEGKIFTSETLDRLIDNTDLRKYKTKETK